MTDEWITDRLPTEADADSDGDVLLPRTPGVVPPCGCYQRYTLVVPSQPWWSENTAARVEVEAPALTRKVVQIATRECSLLAALCDDGTMWRLDRNWTQFPAIPQPE